MFGIDCYRYYTTSASTFLASLGSRRRALLGMRLIRSALRLWVQNTWNYSDIEHSAVVTSRVD